MQAPKSGDISLIAPSSSSEEFAPDSNAGYVDFYGYHCSAGGWIMVGWVLSETPTTFANGVEGNPEARITFDGDEHDGAVVIARYRREDLPDRGTGVVLFVPSPKRPLGRLVSAELMIGSSRYRLIAASGATRLRETELVNRVRPILNDAMRDKARMQLSVLLSRLAYTGEDTVERLVDFIRIEIDEIILCAPDGLVLIGWTLAAPHSIRAVQVRCGTHIAEINASDVIVIERPDVIEAIGKQHGLTDPSCGFMAFVPNIIHNDDPIYIQVETLRLEVGYKNVPRPRLRGMEALRRILDSFEVQYERVLPAFDRVIGPAFLRLNDERVRERPTVTDVHFGISPNKPRYSIIIPLYGRVDFMEYQIGILATSGGCLDTELIYVLDDPRKEQELLLLAESLDLRFRIPFRVLLLSKNMGFAPASNIGLSHSNGTFVCFLNSDVFPGTTDWLPRLADRLCSDKSLGAVAPLLLFEDGSVQHEGMEFRRLRILGDLMFPQHIRKGRRPRESAELIRQQVITGACIFMRRQLAEQLGGFDEVYAIGDFEDSDLCLRLRQLGLTCGVDHSVQLYHLERKSQLDPGQRWRRNLTLCNAWVHHNRWFSKEERTQIMRQEFG